MAKASSRPEPIGKAAIRLIQESLDALLADLQAASDKAAATKAQLAPTVASRVDRILGLPSYREATLTLLAWGIASPGPFDFTQRPKGGRTATAELKRLLEARHISARNAFENIGKNTPELRCGNEQDFDEFLNWASHPGTTDQERRCCFDFISAKMALMARPVLPMPELNTFKLTFARVVRLFQAMLDCPSGGVHQQFIVAACLHAVIEQLAPLNSGLWVETKNVAISDASARTPGDIQIMRGGLTEEAFEVTANPWASKTSSALRSLQSAELPRVHIVADAPASEMPDPSVFDTGPELTVLDIGSFIRTMVPLMRKPTRYTALAQLYRYLDQKQPDIERTNDYVMLLRQFGLAEPTS